MAAPSQLLLQTRREVKVWWRFAGKVGRRQGRRSAADFHSAACISSSVAYSETYVLLLDAFRKHSKKVRLIRVLDDVGYRGRTPVAGILLRQHASLDPLST
eukprot:RCo046127